MPLDTPEKRRVRAIEDMHRREGTSPGLIERAATEIRRRSDKVDRAIEKSVTGRAKQASDENERGTR